MTRVSYAIQTHDLRADMAAELNGCLDGRADLVFDPDPYGRPSAWRTYRRALELTPDDADVRVVIQDDVIVCDRFLAGAEAAIAAKPDRVIAFFVAGNPANHKLAVTRACQRGCSWAELDLTTWLPAVAVAWPARLVRAIPAWFDAQGFPPTFGADDEILGRFLRERGESALATAPSLVEHPDTVKSLIKPRPGDGRDPGRRAALWIGDVPHLGCDPLRIDWTLGPAQRGRDHSYTWG